MWEAQQQKHAARVNRGKVTPTTTTSTPPVPATSTSTTPVAPTSTASTTSTTTSPASVPPTSAASTASTTGVPPVATTSTGTAPVVPPVAPINADEEAYDILEKAHTKLELESKSSAPTKTTAELADLTPANIKDEIERAEFMRDAEYAIQQGATTYKTVTTTDYAKKVSDGAKLPDGSALSFDGALEQYNKAALTYNQLRDRYEESRLHYKQPKFILYTNFVEWSQKLKDREAEVTQAATTLNDLLTIQGKPATDPAVEAAALKLDAAKASRDLAKETAESLEKIILEPRRELMVANAVLRNAVNKDSNNDPDKDQLAICNALDIALLAEDQIVNLGYEQQVFQLQTKAKLIEWKNKGEFRKEFPGEEQLTPAYEELAKILSEARNYLSKLEKDLTPLRAQLVDVQGAITAQELKGQSPEALAALKTAEKRIKGQLEKIDNEIKEFNNYLQNDVLSTADNTLSDNFVAAIKDVIFNRDSNASQNLKTSMSNKVNDFIAGIKDTPVVKHMGENKYVKGAVIGATSTAVVGVTAMSGASLAFGFGFLGAIVAVPPLLVVPLAAVVVYYGARPTAFYAQRWCVMTKNSIKSLFGYPFKSEGDKKEFLIATAGSGSLTKIAKGKDDKSVDGVALHMGSWTTSEEKLNEVLRFVCECRALGLVQRDKNGDLILYMENLPKNKDIHDETRALIFAVCKNFNIKTTGSGWTERTSLIQLHMQPN